MDKKIIFMAESIDTKKIKRRIIKWSTIFIFGVPILLIAIYFIMMAFDVKKEL